MGRRRDGSLGVGCGSCDIEERGECVGGGGVVGGVCVLGWWEGGCDIERRGYGRGGDRSWRYRGGEEEGGGGFEVGDGVCDGG